MEISTSVRRGPTQAGTRSPLGEDDLYCLPCRENVDIGTPSYARGTGEVGARTHYILGA